ncbi:PRC-barrel domain-containing protein [Roseovarius sp. E0-M6]|uniref:PRC-barrel domain-containing protein n=1 Tax=Roseovarius sp. E0-M6 TaxID=3127118 RepID=UPI00300F8BA4
MKFLTTTAIAMTMTATGLMADEYGDMTDLGSKKGELIRSRDITDAEIYTTDAADDEGWTDEATYENVGADWNEVGEVEDLVLSKDGQLVGVVAEVGGFLDVGDKHVAIAIDDMKLVPVDDRSYAYVTRLSEEELEALTSVDEGFWD